MHLGRTALLLFLASSPCRAEDTNGSGNRAPSSGGTPGGGTRNPGGGSGDRGGGRHYGPGNPYWHADRGREALNAHNYPLAVYHYNQAYQLGLNDPGTMSALALSSYQTGDKSAALSAAQEALAQDPSNKLAQSVAKLAETHSPSDVKLPRERQFDAASEQMPVSQGQAAQSYPSVNFFALASPEAVSGGAFPEMRLSSAQLRKIVGAMKRKDYKEAVRMTDQVLQDDPKNAQALNLKAVAEGKLNNYDQAGRDVKKAVDLAPNSVPTLLNYAWILNKTGRSAEALKVADRVLDLQPYNALAYWQKGVALAALKDHKGMLAAFATAARLDPSLSGIYKRALELPDDSDALSLLEPDAGNAGAAPLQRAPFPWLPWSLCAGLSLTWIATQLAARRRAKARR